jgi:hypothetical protein
MKKKVELDFDMPEWAKYHAVDENGDFCVFDEKPFLVDNIVGEGIFETKTNFMILAKNCVVDNWKASLTHLD